MSNGQFNAANNKLSRAIAGGIHKRRRIGSFQIGVQADNNFYLMINRTEMVGKDLPSQDHAISLLHGIFTSNDGSTAGMNAVIADMIADGRGVLANTTPAAPNYTTDPAPSTTGPFPVGTTLSLSSGVLEGFPTPDITYQWKKAGANYATSSTITPVAADIGSTFTCDVTATNDSGSDSVTGISFGQCQAVAPSFTINPVPDGANPPVFLQVSSVNLGYSFAGTSVSVSYQWKIVEGNGTVNNATGTGNTTSSYTPRKGVENEGKVLKCTVTLDNSSLVGGGTAAFDVVFAKIEAIAASIDNIGTGSTGSPNESTSVTLSGLSTSGTTPVTVAYQWTRAGVDIAGATSAAYTPVNADVGSVLAVRITASNQLLYPFPSPDVGTLTIGTVTTSIGTVTVSGSTAPSTGVAAAYTVADTGPATDVTYQWSATTFGGGTATFSAATSASTNITFSNASAFVVKCTLTSATASDSPVFDTLSVTPTSGTAWTVSATSGIANTLGAFTSMQVLESDDVFGDLGMTQLNVGTTYATFFFFTAYARDKFRGLSAFSIEGISMNPSTATYEEQDVTSNGFGLKYTGIDSVCSDWVDEMQGGSISGLYTGTTDATTPLQTYVRTNLTPHSTGNHTTSSTGIGVIHEERTNSGEINTRPRLYLGGYSLNFGSTGSSGTNGSYQFAPLSGGEALSAHFQASVYFSLFAFNQDVNGAGFRKPISETSQGHWPSYNGTQQTYNNYVRADVMAFGDGETNSFKVYDNRPVDHRWCVFTTPSANGQVTDITRLTGKSKFQPSRIYWNAWDVDMIDYYPGYSGGEGARTRDAVLAWFANGNPVPELWQGGSKVSDLTAAAGSTNRIFFTCDDLTTLTASTTYELRWDFSS